MKHASKLFALLLLAPSSYAATNLPVSCALATAAEQPVSACPIASQSFVEGRPDSLVRVCDAATCVYADRRWRPLSEVSAAQFVEVCTADKTINAPAAECQGSTASQWGAQVMVPLAQVRTVAPEFPGTFTVSPDSGVSPLAVTLTWDASGFTGGTCTASGSWSGSKPLKGSQSVTNLTASATYTLTCSRDVPTVGTAVLQWKAPTTNTDGSPLTNLAGYRVAYGQTQALTQVVQVANAGATSYTVGNLSAGTWFFAVRAYTANAESANSNVVSKIIGTTPPQTYAATRNVAVQVVPSPPTLQVVQADVWNATADYRLLAFRRSTRYGTVALGTACDPSRPIRDGYYSVPASAVQWSSSARTSYPVALCAMR